jgi:hypothetical protein
VQVAVAVAVETSQMRAMVFLNLAEQAEQDLLETLGFTLLNLFLMKGNK